MPTNSQISVITMEHILRGFVEKDFDILVVFISARLSGTLQLAFQGREALGIGAGKVLIVDSNSTVIAIGFQVLTAVRIAEAGGSPAD
jgi:fatty acid-binding protein DegV